MSVKKEEEYNLENATKIGSCSYVSTSGPYFEAKETLFQAKSGIYFLETIGGDYRDPRTDKYLKGETVVKLMTNKEAHRWAVCAGLEEEAKEIKKEI